jgi:ATP-dependent Lon protease
MKQLEELSILGLSGEIDENTELIPLLSTEDEAQMNAEKTPEVLPVLPLRNMVLFPGVVIPITVGRDKSIKLVKEAHNSDKIIGVVAQKNQNIEDPEVNHLHETGTVAQILKLLKMPDGSTTIIIQGKKRFRLKEILQTDPYIKAKIESFEDGIAEKNDNRFQALLSSVKDIASSIIKGSPHIPSEAAMALKNIESPTFLINFISSNMNGSVEEKQKLLETANLEKRAEMLLTHLTKDLQMLQLKNDIQAKVKTDIDQQQREYFLHQQMKTIQQELGGSPIEQELKEMEKAAKKKKWSKEVEKVFNKELEKLQRMNPIGAEYSVQVNYLNTLLELPWD